MKKNIKWAAFFVALSLLCLAAIYFMKQTETAEKTAYVVQNGKIIKTIDLADVNKPYEFRVNCTAGGFNTVRVEHNKICIADADCPDKLCVKQGFITDGTIPIVCLPHRLTIYIGEKNEKFDAVAGGR